MYKRDFKLGILEKLLFSFSSLPTFWSYSYGRLGRLVYQRLSDSYGRLADYGPVPMAEKF